MLIIGKRAALDLFFEILHRFLDIRGQVCIPLYKRRNVFLEHPQQVRPELEAVETCDRIEIRGTPNLSLSGSPEIPGGEATIALSVNMIPRLLSAAPGLHCMTDLPVPAAMLGDARQFLRGDYRGG